MKVALIVITDGRWDYLLDTLDSAKSALNYDFSQKLLIDDSGLNNVELDFDGFTIVKHKDRLGLAGAIQSAWDHLDPTTDFVFHLEDDFIFTEPVDIAHMVSLLKANPDLAQMALMRQPWSPEEIAAGGIYQLNPHAYEIQKDFYSHSRLFTFNPCIYPMKITEYGAGLEAEVTERLLDAGYQFAYYGQPGEPAKTIHIGVRRSRGYKL